MILRDWRFAEKLSLATAAARLGMGGANPSRTYQRIETGESPVDADLGAAIVEMTCGRVTTEELQAVRLEWLKANGRARAYSEGEGAR
jgi:transcriptional regulator with XRE-family HTH domain